MCKCKKSLFTFQYIISTYIIVHSLYFSYFFIEILVVPHITNAIQEWVVKEASRPVTPDNLEPEVCIIELGGTIGDIEGMPFVEAFRQFQFRVGRENFFVVHVSLVPQVNTQLKESFVWSHFLYYYVIRLNLKSHCHIFYMFVVYIL